MTDTVKAFIEKVDKLEARYAKDKYATTFQMPREMMLALRDELMRVTSTFCPYCGQRIYRKDGGESS